MINIYKNTSISLLAGASLLTIAACQTTQTAETTDATTTEVTETEEIAAVTEGETEEVAAVTEGENGLEFGEEDAEVRLLDKVMFLDTNKFDSDLSSSLSEDTEAVKINVPAKFSLNEIPERMSVWLQRVQESGGTVNAQPIPDPNAQTRSIIGALISITIELVSYARQEAMYKPADDYDVTLMYDEETGEVKEVIFLQR